MPSYAIKLIGVEWPGSCSKWTGVDYGRTPIESWRVGNAHTPYTQPPSNKIDIRLTPRRCQRRIPR